MRSELRKVFEDFMASCGGEDKFSTVDKIHAYRMFEDIDKFYVSKMKAVLVAAPLNEKEKI
jgi:hypothetical protein